MNRVGDRAPAFELEGSVGQDIQTVSLSELVADGPALLSFYIYDFSPVCSDQMCEMSDMEILTFDNNISVAGISTDGPYSHRVFARQKGLSYPLLTDDYGDVYEQYGMCDQGDADRSERRRGLVVIDSDQVIRYRWIANQNWDDWTNEPLYDAIEVAEELPEAQIP
jgi:peroxiredoxin